MENIVIAIDGPAGAGKTTVAKLLGERLGFLTLNTGSLYRAVALYFDRKNIDITIAEEVKSELKNIDIKVEYLDGEQATMLNGERVDDYLRNQVITFKSSAVSQYDEVRKLVAKTQTDAANTMNVIMEGRDIGSVVAPNAKYKFFIDASVDVRAMRRVEEYERLKIEYTSIEDIKKSIEERDFKDRNRKLSPLIVAKDAIVLDTSEKSVEDIVAEILLLIRE